MTDPLPVIFKISKSTVIKLTSAFVLYFCLFAAVWVPVCWNVNLEINPLKLLKIWYSLNI